MKCFEITKCSEQDRKSCYVWNTFKDLPQEMESIKCWVIKGVYQEENKAQLQKCRKCDYYIKMHQNSGISSNLSSDVAIVTCEGSINNDKSRALDQVWATLKKNNKFKILMDISNVSNIYSCGLGELIKIHKEADASKGILVLVGAQGTAKTIFASTKLDKLLHFAADQNGAISLFEEFKKKQDAAIAAAAAAKAAAEAAAIEAAKPKPAPKPVPKTRIPCWEYWKGKNPKNATKCIECYKQISQTKEPCWIVEGMVEGISFQYVNEECIDYAYYAEFYNSTSYSEDEEIKETKEIPKEKQL